MKKLCFSIAPDNFARYIFDSAPGQGHFSPVPLPEILAD